MSYLVKKPELDRLNGLSWFGRYLAEDFFIAQFLRDKYVTFKSLLVHPEETTVFRVDCVLPQMLYIFCMQKQLLLSVRLSHCNSVGPSVCHTGGSVKNGAS